MKCRKFSLIITFSALLDREHQQAEVVIITLY